MFKLREIILNKKNNFIKKYTFFHFCFQNFSTNLYFQILNLDWSPDMSVPFDIKLMHFVQCGFYLHSVYETVYMNFKQSFL